MADTPKDKPSPENAPKDDGKKHGFVQEIISFLKQAMSFAGFDWNSIMSLGDKQIREEALKLAEGLNTKLSQEHWLRGTWGELLIGQVIARIDSAGEHRKEPIKSIVDKFSDFLERFSTVFYGLQKKGGLTAAGVNNPGQTANPAKPPSVESFSKLKEEWLKNMAERLKNCPDANLTDLRKRLIEEQETLVAAEKLMREGLPAETDTDKKESAKPEADGEKKGIMRLIAEWIEKEWKEEVGLLHDANAKAETKLNAWKAAAKERQAGKDEWQPNWFGKLLASPWNLLWKLLTGFGGRRKPSRKLTPTQKWEDWCRS